MSKRGYDAWEGIERKGELGEGRRAKGEGEKASGSRPWQPRIALAHQVELERDTWAVAIAIAVRIYIGTIALIPVAAIPHGTDIVVPVAVVMVAVVVVAMVMMAMVMMAMMMVASPAVIVLSGRAIREDQSGGSNAESKNKRFHHYLSITGSVFLC